MDFEIRINADCFREFAHGGNLPGDARLDKAEKSLAREKAKPFGIQGNEDAGDLQDTWRRRRGKKSGLFRLLLIHGINFHVSSRCSITPWLLGVERGPIRTDMDGKILRWDEMVRCNKIPNSVFEE